MVLPLLLILVFGIIEYSRMFLCQLILEHAARSGSRFAVVHTFRDEVDTEQIRDLVHENMMGFDVHFKDFDPQTDILVYRADPITGEPATDDKGSHWSKAAFGEPVCIEIQAEYMVMVPQLLMMDESVSLLGRCLLTSEAN